MAVNSLEQRTWIPAFAGMTVLWGWLVLSLQRCGVGAWLLWQQKKNLTAGVALE